jgi:hypothetical protein
MKDDPTKVSDGSGFFTALAIPILLNRSLLGKEKYSFNRDLVKLYLQQLWLDSPGITCL